MNLLVLPRLRRALMWGVTAVNGAFLALYALALLAPLPDRDVGFSTVVAYRDGEPAHVFLAPDDRWRLRVSLDDLDPKLVEALVALEDQRFWSHDGVDPLAVARAAWSDLTQWRRVSGASTLTMQLARLLERRPRTWSAKLVEMFRAVQLDLRLSKREILEAYLARTPYGANVEGVEAAAWSYFGHGARHLTPLEIATLLAVPQGPSRFAPSPANRERLRARRDAIVHKLVAAGVFTGADADAAVADAAATPALAELRPMPRDAAHAAVWLRGGGSEARVASTLDRGAQRLAERHVRLRAPELRAKGIFGASVVVVDHRTRDVVALVGNLDFADARHGGQIAMFDRPRSPGSTLKPFLYALAIDRGRALPGYLVPDLPVRHGGYRPRNFDGDFSGLVTLRDALARSLNLPFVEVLRDVGVEAFAGELVRMGVEPSRARPGAHGLALVTGGIELTPLEVAAMYATLAGDGRHRPLHTTLGAPPSDGIAIFGAGAAWLAREALSSKDRPDFPRRRDVTGAPPAIHWKTGTSTGFRDAWAAGSGATYTVVVWTGNADGKPTSELVGSEAAGPLLFDILEGLDGHRPRVTPPPDELVEVEVCAYSGHVATSACDHRTRVRAPVHAVPSEGCPYHQVYDVDRTTGHAVVPACRVPGRAYTRTSFVVLPSAVTAWLAAHDRALPEAPVFDDTCGELASSFAHPPPAVTSPTDGQVVTLLPGVPAKRQRIPLAATTRSRELSWFVDGALVATVRAHERAYWVPAPGTHEIVVADAAGKRAHRTITVH